KLALITIAFVAAVAWIVKAAFHFAAPVQGDWKPFVAFAGVPIAALSSILAAVFSLLVALEQRPTAVAVEHLKDTLSARRKAFDALSAAAATYYYFLSALETGDWDLQKIQAAEMGMIQASGFIKDIPEGAQ